MSTVLDILTEGWRLHQAGDLAAAERAYRQALVLAPENSDAWCYLGMACNDQQRLDEAVACYGRALQLRPDFPIALNNLGNTLHTQDRLDESLAAFDHALRLKPDYARAYKGKSTVLALAGRYEEALEGYRKALELDPDDAEAHKDSGVMLLLLGRWEEGWPEYRWRWQAGGLALPNYPQPRWDGSSLAGKTILLLAEQGLGDTIHFIRYGAVLKERFGCRVIATFPKGMVPLLSTCPGIDALVPQDEQPPAFDVFAPMLDLPGLLGHSLDALPDQPAYLSADPALVEHWRRELDVYGGFKIGLVWQGSTKHHADRMRSFPLAELAPLGKLRGVRLFSLQKGHGAEQIDSLCGLLDVVPLGSRLDESTGAFVETAAVLKNLDLVISADTAMVHLAGALGVPVWTAVGQLPDWRWGVARDDTPWYSTMRLFRRSNPGTWREVFERMAEALRERDARIRPKTAADYRLASCGMNRLARTRHGLTLYNRHDRYIGHSLDRYGEFSEGECELFRQAVRPGSVVVEAGAHLGSHTLLFSELVGPRGAVLAFEPQRILFQTLCANMALNDRTNVFARWEALGEAPGLIYVPPLDYHAENNFGGLALGGFQQGEPVAVTTIDGLGLAQCHFLKLDVEGMELSVLKGARQTIARHRPTMYVENDRTDRSAALVEHLLSLGYDLYWHTPPLFNPANYYGDPANEFGRTVSANMLCIHQSVKQSITGLRRVEKP